MSKNRIFSYFLSESTPSKIIYGTFSGDYDKRLPRKGGDVYRSLTAGYGIMVIAGRIHDKIEWASEVRQTKSGKKKTRPVARVEHGKQKIGSRYRHDFR